MTAPFRPHVPPPNTDEWQAYLDKIDAQVRREQETAAAEDLWVPAAIMAIVVFVGGFAFYIGGLLS